MRRRQRGAGYLGLIFAVAAFSIGLAAVGEVWSTQVRREREAELLRAGEQFRAAIASYYAASRPGTPAFPARLEDLLEDRRGPALRRHLRRVYVDPMTGSTEWGLITTVDGRIRGVFSRSALHPIKTSNFGSLEERFATARTYSDWRFEFEPRNRNVSSR